MDLISVGEQLIDFIPGTEPGTYIRAAGELRQMSRLQSHVISWRLVFVGKSATTILVFFCMKLYAKIMLKFSALGERVKLLLPWLLLP